MTQATQKGAHVQRALVIGDGGWGTALALLLDRNGVHTTLWSAFPEHAEEMRRASENLRFLPGVPLPSTLRITADPMVAAEGAELVVTAVPTQHLRGALRRFEDAIAGGTPVVSATKGIEIETFKTPLQVIGETLGARRMCVLTGPSHAEEVARGKPASVVAASADAQLAQQVQRAFSGATFRVYTNNDALGAEYAGALKNVIAIAAGISDGLELGDNAKSALLVRGMVEIARFACARGAKAETFFGLAGVGDLATTCFSRHSRNRAVGEALGRGRKLADVLASTRTVAEGVYTTQALFGPEADLGDLPMPIAAQVHAVLFRGKDPREAVLELMTRAPAGEMDGIAGARA